MVRDGEVQVQLRKILESPAFSVSARSRQFLEFCVDRAIRGESGHLKETTIAIEVFQRATDYNPKIDPIVRVHARRVREKLELYYKDFGPDDPIKIDIPKGGYVPQISRTLPRRKTDFTDWVPNRFPSHEEFQQHIIAVKRSPAVSQPPSSAWHDNRLILAVLVGIAMALVIFMSYSNRPQTIAITSMSPLTPVDLQSDRVSQFAWSPDHNRIAYTAASEDNKTRIYIQDLSSPSSPVPLLDSDNSAESNPTWSPDGREIAFARRTGPTRFEVVRCDLASKKLVSLGIFTNFLAYSINAIALDWSPDGRSIVTSEQAASTDPVRLVLVSVSNGARTPMTSPPTSSTGDIDARFSPDGQWIAFQRGGLGDLYLVSVTGEQSQSAIRLTFNTRGVRGIAWIDQGKSLLFGKLDDKISEYGLYEIARSGGTPRRVSPQGFDIVFPAVLSTGKLAAEHREVATSVVEYSLTNSSNRVRILAGNNNSAEVSPDGNSFVYVNDHSGCMELWLSEREGSAPRQITNFQCAGTLFFPSWAPDSKSVAFSYRENGATNIFVYHLPDQKLEQISHTRNRDITPIYSSDGKYIYYSSNDDGTSRIWRLRTDGSSRAEPMFVEGTTGFAPSSDGKWLYFLRSAEGTTILRKNLETGDTQEFFQVPGRPTFAKAFQIAGDRIFLPISQNDLSASDVYVIDTKTPKAHVALHLKGLAPSSQFGLSGFSVSADGSKLLTERVERYKTTLYTAVLGR